MTHDPFVEQLREQISDNDRAIVDAINKRLELVATLKRYKEKHGIPLVDPDREESMVRSLVGANRGPLSEQELERTYRELLALTKREVFSGVKSCIATESGEPGEEADPGRSAPG